MDVSESEGSISSAEEEIERIVLKKLRSKNKEEIIQGLSYLSELSQKEELKLSESCTKRLLNCLLPLLNAEEPDEEDQILVLASASIANLCGRSASGEMVKTWTFPHNKESITVQIKELSYVDGDLGWKTWFSSVFLSERIARGEVKVEGKSVIELGCGTGIAGIIASKCGARRVTLTDFHHKVLENATHNISLNHCQQSASVLLLDWRQFTHSQKVEALSEGEMKDVDVILAADVVYDEYHSTAVPQVVQHFFRCNPNCKFYCILPSPLIRLGISEFETNMNNLGFTVHKEIIPPTEETQVEFQFYRVTASNAIFTSEFNVKDIENKKSSTYKVINNSCTIN